MATLTDALADMIFSYGGPSSRYAFPTDAAGTFLFYDNWPDAQLNSGTPTKKVRQWTGGGGSWNAPNPSSGSASDWPANTAAFTAAIVDANGIPRNDLSKVG